MKEISQQPLGGRVRAYMKMTGPGYMQSAMTLGGGSVASCAALGSMFGYKYLWVQVVAMFFGFVILACVAKQTCNSGERAYETFRRELHLSLALLWAGSAFIATILWHIPQYSLTANGLITLAEGVSVNLDSTGARAGMGIVLFGVACGVVSLYHKGADGLKAYERIVKSLVWSVVAAFTIVVVVSARDIQWGAIVKGIFGITFLQDLMSDGMEEAAIKPVIGALAAAVGINMIFLYPYSLTEKGWGKEHKELAYYDLFSGMAVPFILATSMMVIAVGHTIGPDAGGGSEVRDIREIIPVLSPVLGNSLALLITGFGITAIGFSTIITHMLAVGFIGCEIFNAHENPKARWWFSLIPGIGIVGVIIKFPIPLAITASTLAMPLMPVSVICFLILLNRRSYMKDEMPLGMTRLAWNVILVVAITVMSGAAIIALQKNWGTLQGMFQG
jgi:Mn2+/Fe2+ NRAMP family transporter